ncbi:membrane protein [Vibrio sp. qd031]|uniref:Z-ring associated protein ZapG n=1 Tax=Vibrio sp. qd031 TaxID=1603038 RepID=UPI000A107EDD|nr:Z-ring associated protein ZapG [Vibrio sp. qd031]ORT48292.1 membrane protein [Vibrio sp. qd031]
MPWIFGVVGLVVGLIVGVVATRMTAPQYSKQKDLQKALDTSKYELEQQKQDLTDHFARSAELLEEMGKQYSNLYQHMAKSSSEMLPNIPEQDNPFVKKLDVTDNHVESEPAADIEGQPKDYANGATGMLKSEEKVIVDSPNVAKPA